MKSGDSILSLCTEYSREKVFGGCRLAFGNVADFLRSHPLSRERRHPCQLPRYRRTYIVVRRTCGPCFLYVLYLTVAGLIHHRTDLIL